MYTGKVSGMPSHIVRMEKQAHHTLQELSGLTGESMQSILSRAVEEYRRKVFLEMANQSFADLRNDPARWQEELAERAAWEAALGDGLVEE